MKLKQALACFLSLLCIAGCLSACGENKTETETKASSVSTNEVETDDGLTDLERRSLTKDNLPDGLDYDERVFTSLTWKEKYELDVYGTENIGDVIKDSVYQRNLAVEERLNIVMDNRRSDASTFTDYGKEVDVLQQSNSQDFSAIFTFGNSVIQNGFYDDFMDLSNIDNLSLESPWWWQNAMKEVSFDTKHQKFLIGDICLSNYTQCGVVLVNLTDYESAFTEETRNDFYQMVIDRKWTLEELRTRATRVYVDVNGDGVSLKDDGDYLGLSVANIEMIKFLEYGFDIQRYSRDEDDCVILDYDTDRAALATDKLIELLFETDGVYWQEQYQKYEDFAQGRTMFQVSWLMALTYEQTRKMSDDYAVAPMPLLDLTQKEYTSNIQNSSQMAAILKCLNDDEAQFAGTVLEAMCTESYRNVVLPFYEVVLKTSYTRDSGAGQLIDIIHDVATKNFLYEYQPGSGCGVLISKVVLMETNKLASEYKSAAESTAKFLSNNKKKYYKD